MARIPLASRIHNGAALLRTEFAAQLRLHRRKIAATALLILSGAFLMQILSDIEYAGQDPTLRGLRIFDWAKVFFPGKYKSLQDSPVVGEIELFPGGENSINGRDVIQGGVYDCRFLSAVASMACSAAGRQAISNMIKYNDDKSFTVTFSGDKQNPVTVAPLTENELRLYARLEDRGTKQSKGHWLAVIEKAYGKYRTEHMNAYERFLRFFRHGLLEGRFDSAPVLAGFGASYGSGDDNAFSLLTGKPAVQHYTWGWHIGSFGLGKDYVSPQQIQSWFDRSKVQRQFEDEHHQVLVNNIKSGGIANAGTERSPEARLIGLRSGHAYAILGYDPQQRILLISDPMGKVDLIDPSDGSIRDKVLDGIFTMRLDEFNKYFSHLAAQN